MAKDYLNQHDINFPTWTFGLPEVDDRYHIWRVPLLATDKSKLGEIVVDARTSLVQENRSTDLPLIRERSFRASLDAGNIGDCNVRQESNTSRSKRSSVVARSELRNTIICGDSEQTLADLPAESIDLVFTSPPYFNARPDYTEYAAYDEYLGKISRVISQCHRLLSEGRFFVMNVAPVLLRRTSRNEASRRIAVPFDLHQIICREGFDFIDDIIWEKPSGAGWATGRGRRFAADRNPLQYKAVPVTEYVLVYRKQTEKLIDWNIRNHHDPDLVEQSKITGEYERTNIWRISPSSSKDHPAIFPTELADRVIRYYSFKKDVVLDPFAGSGTVGESCVLQGRRFVLAEIDPTYIELIKSMIVRRLGREAEEVRCINTAPIVSESLL